MAQARNRSRIAGRFRAGRRNCAVIPEQVKHDLRRANGGQLCPAGRDDRHRRAGWIGPGTPWPSSGKLEALEKTPNIGSFIGQGSIRSAVIFGRAVPHPRSYGTFVRAPKASPK